MLTLFANLTKINKTISMLETLIAFLLLFGFVQSQAVGLIFQNHDSLLVPVFFLKMLKSAFEHQKQIY